MTCKRRATRKGLKGALQRVRKTVHKAQVSNLGRYRNIRGVVTTPRAGPSGYASVGVNNKNYQLHRLVAAAFLGTTKRIDQTTVNHIDRNPGNNRVENLEWASTGEQAQHSYATNENRVSSAPKQSKPVCGRKLVTHQHGVDAQPAEWISYASSAEAARKLGLNPGSISSCCRGKYKQTRGYEFKYDTPTEPELLFGEKWRDVSEIGGAAVSSLGRYRNMRGVVTTPRAGPDGYARVMVNKKSYYIHRLVVAAFLGTTKRSDQTTVNHIDRNPGNNRVENLEWASTGEQAQHAHATNENRVSNGPKQSKPVCGRKLVTDQHGVDAQPVEWISYASSHEAARDLGLDSGNISHCCRGERKQTRGYEFKYDTPTEPELLPGEEWCDVIV